MNKRFTAIFLLGFSSGLPLFLTDKTLQAWMTIEKVDLKTIGFFSLVTLPYSLKFLWAPLLDRFAPPFLGRRRGWIALTQLLLAGGIAAISGLDPKSSLHALAAAAVLVAFFSATQDVVYDAWRADVLSDRERGPGAAMGVLGYRIALLVTGSLAMILADHLGWQAVYLLMAILQVLLLVPTLLAHEPDHPPLAPKSLQEAVVLPFVAFFKSRGIARALAVLAFIALFKWGVYLVGKFSTPFLLHLEFTQTDIGAVVGGAGLFATIAGTAAGGWVMTRMSVGRGLWVFGFLQAACALSFWGLALHGHNYPWMVTAVIAEYFFIGMGSAALVAFMLGECDPRYSATQFALLSSLMAVSRDVLTSPGGVWAQNLGWPHFFLASIAASLPALVLLRWVAPWTPRGVRVASPGVD